MYDTGQVEVENNGRKETMMKKVRERVNERKRQETYLTMFKVRGSPNYTGEMAAQTSPVFEYNVGS